MHYCLFLVLCRLCWEPVMTYLYREKQIVMEYFSYHTHTSYCDGKSTAEEMVLRAIELGLKSIGFSSHAPLPNKEPWSMDEILLEAYVDEIEELKVKYTDKIDVYRSLEIDYIPGVTASFKSYKKKAHLDYTIGSVHLVKVDSNSEFWFLDGPDTNFSHGVEVLFDGDIKNAVTAYFDQVIEMIITQQPDIVGHIDKVKMNNKGRYFSEDDKWYLDLLDKTIIALKESDCIVEVNTRGIYKKKSGTFFPDAYFLKQCLKYDIPVTISSDAHHVDELISVFDSAQEMLKRIGFVSVRVFEGDIWCDHPL